MWKEKREWKKEGDQKEKNIDRHSVGWDGKKEICSGKSSEGERVDKVFLGRVALASNCNNQTTRSFLILCRLSFSIPLQCLPLPVRQYRSSYVTSSSRQGGVLPADQLSPLLPPTAFQLTANLLQGQIPQRQQRGPTRERRKEMAEWQEVFPLPLQFGASHPGVC